MVAAKDVDFTARVLAYRGHLIEAARALGYVLAGSYGDPPVLVEAALLGAIPVERVSERFARHPIEPIFTVRWWGVRRDTLGLRRLAARAQRGEVDWPMALEASAYLALARHDTTKALHVRDASPTLPMSTIGPECSSGRASSWATGAGPQTDLPPRGAVEPPDRYRAARAS